MPSTPSDSQQSICKTLYIFGAGACGREVAWIAEQTLRPPQGDLAIIFVVDKRKYLSPEVDGHAVHLLEEIDPSAGSRFVVAIGDPAARTRIAMACVRRGMCPVTLIHPRTEMSLKVEFGEGTIVYPGCVITTGIFVGKHVHINVGCTISHDAKIGDFATLSPGVHVAGHVHIGNGAFLGTGASIVNGTDSLPLTIGDGAIVAAGACVTLPVVAGSMVAGVPAVRKK